MRTENLPNNGLPLTPGAMPGEAYPGEGDSFLSARFECYTNTAFMVWDQPGQTVEIAPVPRRGTSYGWCTAESDFCTVPDIFNVNGGERSSAIEISREGKPPIIIQDGHLYLLSKPNPRVVNLEEYFTPTHPVIGGDWQLSRRDGGTPLLIPNIKAIRVELSRDNEHLGGFQFMPMWPTRHQSTGQSAIKLRSNALRQKYPHHAEQHGIANKTGIIGTLAVRARNQVY